MEYVRYRPTFALDSIWNYFSGYAIPEYAFNGTARWPEVEGLRIEFRAFERFFEPDRLDVAVGWIGEQRQVWADRYDRLDEHLAHLRTRPRRKERS